MLILANVLEVNGGTTFILRLAKQYQKQNDKIGVLVLVGKIDGRMANEIAKHADIFYLRDFLWAPFRWAFGTPLGMFLPLDMRRLGSLIAHYGGKVHVLGVFGQLLAIRYLQNAGQGITVSVGVYHVNEFMFEGVSHYFSNKALEAFRRLPSRAVIFFNEASREAYEKFFAREFRNSVMAPIGIELPASASGGGYASNRIVSVGNLYNFKTYHYHVISCLKSLRAVRPGLVYEIYGEGPDEAALKALSDKLGVSDAVQFKGRIAYDSLSTVLRGAFAFVGSGTAVLEAASHGIPSVVGIDSSKAALTYGYLSDVPGLTYNEMVLGQKVVPFCTPLEALMASERHWKEVALACKAKAETFGIERTMTAFNAAGADVRGSQLGHYSNVRAGVSFLVCALKQVIGVDRTFANRRNQGNVTIGTS